MDRTGSQLPLVDNDFLNSDCDGEVSSGYESNDYCSPSRGPSPAHSRPSRGPDNSHVMIFKSTSDLQDSLAFILSMPELCDVTFLVDKAEVPVYGVKAILATRSRPLYQLVLQHQRQMELEGASKKKRKSKKTSNPPAPHRLVISVPDYQAGDFKSFITFVHSGKVKVDVNNVVGLLCASAEFGLRGLHTACTDFIKRCQSHGQTREIISSAIQYQSKKPAQKLLAEIS